MQKNLLDELNPNFKNGLGDLLTDPIALNEEFESSCKTLKSQYPKLSNDMIYYWAARITIFAYGNGSTEETRIKGINKEEPNQITLTLLCDYSS